VVGNDPVTTTLADRLPADALWQRIQPCCHPPSHARGGAPRTVSDRACMAAVLFMARTSTPWALLPIREFGCGSVTSCGRRFAEWARAGVFERLQQLLLDELGAVGALDWARVTVDSFSLRAVRGEVDRAKPGCKLHRAAEGTGLPLSLLITAANTPERQSSRPCWTTSPGSVRPGVDGAIDPTRSTPTRPTTTAAAAATSRGKGSGCGSPAVPWSHRPGSAATAGRWNARSPGWPAAAGCASATTRIRAVLRLRHAGLGAAGLQPLGRHSPGAHTITLTRLARCEGCCGASAEVLCAPRRVSAGAAQES
jgi:transposase